MQPFTIASRRDRPDPTPRSVRPASSYGTQAQLRVSIALEAHRLVLRVGALVVLSEELSAVSVAKVRQAIEALGLAEDSAAYLSAALRSFERLAPNTRSL